MSIAPAPPPGGFIPPECIPDVSDLVIEDGVPVDSTLSEKQMRLLTEPLYSSWPGPGEQRPFAVLANVGLFHAYRQPPIVPDVMLSLDVRWPEDLRNKENNSYFVWVIGKVPEVVVEIVSNREGGEDDEKLHTYARLRIAHYAIFDPLELLSEEALRIYELRGQLYQRCPGPWLEGAGLGLCLWAGPFEGNHETWLRWCDRAGQVIPTGAEARDRERRRAEAEALRAEAETRRAEQALQDVARLREKLRLAGIDPES